VTDANVVSRSKPLAVVIGANGGIGSAVSERLLKDGFGIAMVYGKGRDRIDQLLDSQGGETADLFARQCDLASVSDVRGLCRDRTLTSQRLRVLVNAAGLIHRRSMMSVREREWDRVIAVNLKSVYFLTQGMARHMIKASGGSIVNMASASVITGGVSLGAYGIAKAGLIMLTRIAAQELGPYGIRVNAVSPGFIRTPMTEAAYSNPDSYAERLALTPLRRIGDAVDVAGAVSFLCSEDAGFVTGQTIVVDGGSHDGTLGKLQRAAPAHREEVVSRRSG
jgi:3-oxoacyl-[acyl-carrier protein] reductase